MTSSAQGLKRILSDAEFHDTTSSPLASGGGLVASPVGWDSRAATGACVVAAQKESARALYELELELELELTPFRGHCHPLLQGGVHRDGRSTTTVSDGFRSRQPYRGCAPIYRAMSRSREELIGTSSDRYLQLAGPTAPPVRGDGEGCCG